MLILAMRTDKPEAEVYLYKDKDLLDQTIWQAHRALAETLHQKINDLLKRNGKDWHDINGLVVYKGPGSFTGLRIGLTVANTLAEPSKVAIVGANGDDWRQRGLDRLLNGENERLIVPEYGAPVHITAQKK